jgi:hypothetical protein
MVFLREKFPFNIYLFLHFGKILYPKKTLSQIDDYQQKDIAKLGYRADVEVFFFLNPTMFWPPGVAFW